MSGTRTILWLHENFVSARQGGNSRATLGLSALLEAGWQIDLICTTRSYLGETYANGEALVERDGGLRIHRLAAGTRKSRARQYIHFCREALRYAATLPRPDLIFTSSPSLPQVAPALWLASRHRLPLVLEVRDLWPAFLEQGQLLRSPLLLAAMRVLEALAYQRADEVISVSPAFSPYLTAMGVEEKHLTIAPTGADPALLKQTPETARTWRTERGLENAFLVLYAGSFNSSYGLELIESAIDSSAKREVHWLLAGAGERSETIAACAERNSHAHFLGLLPKNELRAVLKSVDLGISTHASWPLLGTTISGKLFDYFSAGVPVINLSPGQMAEIVHISGGGWQSGRDATELLENIAKVASMPQEGRSAVGRKGQEWLSAHMHGTTTARRVAGAVERAWQGGHSQGIFGLAVSLTIACLQLVTNRARRSLRRLYGDDSREKTIRTSLAHFLAEPAGQPDKELEVPELLSD